MANQTINVNTTCVNGTTSVPPVLTVRQPKGSQITINWNASNAQFPSSLSDAWSWKQGHAGTGTLSRQSDKQIRLVYSMPSASVTWKYNIKLNNCNAFDPDIDNEIPPGDEEKPKPRKPASKKAAAKRTASKKTSSKKAGSKKSAKKRR